MRTTKYLTLLALLGVAVVSGKQNKQALAQTKSLLKQQEILLDIVVDDCCDNENDAVIRVAGEGLQQSGHTVSQLTLPFGPGATETIEVAENCACKMPMPMQPSVVVPTVKPTAPPATSFSTPHGGEITYLYVPTSNGQWQTITYNSEPTASGEVTVVSYDGVETYVENVQQSTTPHGTVVYYTQQYDPQGALTEQITQSTGYTIGGQSVTYETITTAYGGSSSLTEETVVTPSGGLVTYATGTNSLSEPISYTVLPTTSPSYVPAPVSYQTSKGGQISYSYLPTPSGYVTETIEVVPTAHGEVTYYTVPTVNGYSSYVQQSATGVNTSGQPVTYVVQENSTGGHTTITESSHTTPLGDTITYAVETLSNGETVSYTYETSYNSEGRAVTYVTRTESNGKTLSYTEVAPSSPSYVPAPTSYVLTNGDTVSYEYVSTSNGYETITDLIVPTPHGSETYVVSPTPNGYTSYIEQSVVSTTPAGAVVSYITATNSQGLVETETATVSKTISGGTITYQTVTDSTGVCEYTTETKASPSGNIYTYIVETGTNGARTYITEETFTTPSGKTGTYVTETNSIGGSLSYTVVPSSAPSYVPSPIQWTSNNEVITESFVATSSGIETITYVESVAPDGSIVTVVVEPNSTGKEVTVTEESTTVRSPSGAVITYIQETTSEGGHETLVSSESSVCTEVVHKHEITDHGGHATYNYDTVTNTLGQIITYVTGTATNGQSVSFTSLPISSTIPTAQSYVIDGITYTFSYTPSSNGGWDTISYITEPTPSGYITYVDVPTANGGTSTYTEAVQTAVNPSGQVVSYIAETLSNGETVALTEYTAVNPSGVPVTYVTETTSHGGITYLSEVTETTQKGGVITYVQGTTSNGGSTVYTLLPPTDSSYVPPPSTWSSNGQQYTLTYIPTSNGYETVTYVSTKNSMGNWVTYVEVPTPSGFSDYTIQTEVITERNGQTATVTEETTSHGATEVFTLQSVVTSLGGTTDVETVTESNGQVETITQSQTWTPRGSEVTYETITLPSGLTDQLTYSVVTGTNGQTETIVTGTASNGKTFSRTVTPLSSQYVVSDISLPTPSSYTTVNGKTVSYSYIPTQSGGFVTDTYVVSPTPSGYITYVVEGTANGGTVTYSESSETIRAPVTLPNGQVVTVPAVYTYETLSNGETETALSYVVDGVTYYEVCTGNGGTTHLTEETFVTQNGGTGTLVSGTTELGGSINYTILPSSSPSYVPAPVSYSTPAGGQISYSYIPTPSGFETETVSIVPTPSGYVTYVEVPTPNGYSSYTESSSHCTLPDGAPVTMYFETLSNGATETIQQQTTTTAKGGVITAEILQTSNGGRSYQTSEEVIGTSGSPVTFVSGVTSGGASFIATESPASPTYVPIPSSTTYVSDGKTYTLSYVPTSTGGWETVTYITEVNPSGQEVTYVTVPTADHGYSSYTEQVATAKTAHGVVSYIVETTSSGATEQFTESTVVNQWGTPVTYVTETTPEGGVSYFVETVGTTVDGGLSTYVTGVNSHNSPITYTVLPTSSPSYVPAPSSHSTVHGGDVSYSYVRTPSGYETITKESTPTAHGTVTYVKSPTSSGWITYTETAESITTPGGLTGTYYMSTDSTGAMETVTEVSEVVSGVTETVYYVTDYSGVPETITQETITAPNGLVYTYVQETTPHGVSELTYAQVETSGGQISTEVTGTNSHKQQVSYTIPSSVTSDFFNYVPSSPVVTVPVYHQPTPTPVVEHTQPAINKCFLSHE